MKRRAYLAELENQPPLKKTMLVRSPAMSLAQTQAVRREVNRQIARKQDYKQATRTVATTVDWNGTVYNLLNNMARGDGSVDNFEGAHISPKTIHARVQLAAYDATNIFRLILFQWSDSSTPVTSGVLDPALVGTAYAPVGYRNWTNRHVYKILVDRTIQLQNTAYLTGGNGNVITFDMFYKGKKLRNVYYASASATIQKGGLYLLCVSDSSVAQHPGITFTCETVFTDE